MYLHVDELDGQQPAHYILFVNEAQSRSHSLLPTHTLSATLISIYISVHFIMQPLIPLVSYSIKFNDSNMYLYNVSDAF